ncbi:MAG: bacillithiol biosynthesis cysteine-adding enzyme BshC, partial [Myxococcota bacterium]
MTDRFAHAYLAQDARTTAFVPHRFDSAADRAQAVAKAAKRSVSPEVQAYLRTFNAQLPPSSARDTHIEALGEPGTVCVVTGQQVGLYLGPLYTLYKAAAAVVNARALAAETGHKTVPVFWLQTEDHDFAEVATTYVPQSGGEPLALTARGDADNRVSMAHRYFADDATTLNVQLKDILGSLPYAEETVARFAHYYRPGAGWVSAFSHLLAEIFAPHGLVFFDPRQAEVTNCCAPIHRHAIHHAASIADRLLERSAALDDAGFSAPVHVRSGAPLNFFHPDGPEHARYRLVPTADEWSIVGDPRRLSSSALDAALEQEPGCFSTSALLRPLLQDSLLPTAAYVGGPGEIDYFAQLGPVYDAFDLPMPLLIPRARFAVVDAKARRGLNELTLPLESFAQPEADLLKRVAARPDHLTDPDALLERMLSSLRTELTQLAPQLAELQSGLQKAADRTVDAVERSCGKFVEKYRGAVNQADTKRADVVRRLKATLFPLDAPQERILSLPYFAARHGMKPFVECVVDSCRPYHADLEALE